MKQYNPPTSQAEAFIDISYIELSSCSVGISQKDTFWHEESEVRFYPMLWFENTGNAGNFTFPVHLCIDPIILRLELIGVFYPQNALQILNQILLSFNQCFGTTRS